MVSLNRYNKKAIRCKAMDFSSEAARLNGMVDAAIEEMRKVEDQVNASYSGRPVPPSKVGAKLSPMAQRTMATIGQEMQSLAAKVTSIADANKLAQAFGFADRSGGVAGILKKVRMKLEGRIGAFVRPYA